MRGVRDSLRRTASATACSCTSCARRRGRTSSKFIRSKLLGAVRTQSDLRTGAVKYLKLADRRGKRLRFPELPFLKRFAFEHEAEFRMIYESKAKRTKLDIDIPLSCIDGITLSPWIHRDLSTHVKRTIRSIQGCSGLAHRSVHLDRERGMEEARRELGTLNANATRVRGRDARVRSTYFLQRKTRPVQTQRFRWLGQTG